MNEKELMEWVASKQHYGRFGSTVAYGPQCVDASDLRELFKDMALVDAEEYHRLRQLALSVDTALVSTGSTLDTYDSPTAALNALIAWEIQVATDPLVNGGQSLVPADAVVLTLEDAETLRDAMHGQRPDHWTESEHAVETKLAQAIEQAKGQGNG